MRAGPSAVPIAGVTAARVRREARLDKAEQIEVAVPNSSRAFRRVYENYFARRLELTLTQALVLGRLDTAANHVFNQTELADRVGLRKTAIGAALDGLIVRGYVDRIGDPRDGRAKPLSLTAAGSELARVVDDAFGELAAVSRQNTTPEQRRQLVNALNTMRENLEELDRRDMSESVGLGANEEVLR